MGKVAFITGGNGITGSAILEYLVQNTTSEKWSQIIVTSRSPFKTTVSDPRITFLALDFNEDSSKLSLLMKPLCTKVTHAYFSSYVHKDDFVELNQANQRLFDNFLAAIVEVAPDLENITLQTGGKYYNVHLGPAPTPCREEDPRLAPSSENFYYPQEDNLKATQRGKRWSYNIIRPGAIIGSTNKPNGMNSAMTIALYFRICKELGTLAPMPTNQSYWNGVEDVSSAKLVADLTIFVSTNPRCANEAFNIANGDFFTWRYMWPRLAAYYGAEASPNQTFHKPQPKEGDLQQEFTLIEWSADKREVWNKLCEKSGQDGAKSTFDYGTFAFQDWVFRRTWTANFSINKARKYGWTGHVDSYDAFINAFEKFKYYKMIPD